MGKKIFIDCGAWTGCSIEYALGKMGCDQVFAFECCPKNLETLRNKFKDDDRVVIADVAVWTKDGMTKFYRGLSQSGTIIKEKTSGEVNINDWIDVRTIDFSSWIKDNFKPEDNLIVKFNIEGAEYEIIRKMAKDDTIKYFDDIYIQWHYNKMGMGRIEDKKVKKLIPNFKQWEVMKWK